MALLPLWQVFHVPLEERKYKDMNQFGEGEQAKICLEIMQRTGAHLELSLAKDQGLSIMVSGKLDAVMKARKDIVARLQTQVGVLGQLALGLRCEGLGSPLLLLRAPPPPHISICPGCSSAAQVLFALLGLRRHVQVGPAPVKHVVLSR